MTQNNSHWNKQQNVFELVAIYTMLCLNTLIKVSCMRLDKENIGHKLTISTMDSTQELSV